MRLLRKTAPSAKTKSVQSDSTSSAIPHDNLDVDKLLENIVVKEKIRPRPKSRSSEMIDLALRIAEDADKVKSSDNVTGISDFIASGSRNLGVKDDSCTMANTATISNEPLKPLDTQIDDPYISSSSAPGYQREAAISSVPDKDETIETQNINIEELEDDAKTQNTSSKVTNRKRSHKPKDPNNSNVNVEKTSKKPNPTEEKKSKNYLMKKLKAAKENKSKKSSNHLSDESKEEINQDKATTSKASIKKKPLVESNLAYKTHIQSLVNDGVFVTCDRCQKFRQLKYITFPSDVPSTWFCEMHETDRLTCEIPEDDFSKLFDYFINNEHTLGSIVWARVPGYCWWPAIVDSDPDIDVFFWCYSDTDDVSHYHVTFLDKDVSRSWVCIRDIKQFHNSKDADHMKFVCGKKNYTDVVKEAAKTAEEAMKLSIEDRLKRYSFGVRFKGKTNMWTRHSGSVTNATDMQLQQLHHQGPAERDMRRKRGRPPAKMDLETAASMLEAESQVLVGFSETGTVIDIKRESVDNASSVDLEE